MDNPYAPPASSKPASSPEETKNDSERNTPRLIPGFIAILVALTSCWYLFAFFIRGYEFVFGAVIEASGKYSSSQYLLWSVVCGSGAIIGFFGAYCWWRHRFLPAIGMSLGSNFLVLVLPHLISMG